jgi:hypothetical protein
MKSDDKYSVFEHLNHTNHLREIPVKDCGVGCKFYTFQDKTQTPQPPEPTLTKVGDNRWIYDPNPPSFTGFGKAIFCFDHSDEDAMCYWFFHGNVWKKDTILLCFPRFFEDQKFVKVDPSVFPPEIQEFLNS